MTPTQLPTLALPFTLLERANELIEKENTAVAWHLAQGVVGQQQL